MKKATPITIILVIITLSSCYRQAYFVSPLNGHSNTYRTIPLHSEQTKQAWYINNTFFTGSSNDQQTDRTFAWQTSLSSAHNFKQFQAYYGLGATVGRYTVTSYDTTLSYSSVNYRKLNEYAGRYFFGSVDFNGGLNVVVPFDGGGEWRAIGIETSLHREFGDYLQLRRQIPDTLATFIVDKAFFGTLGGYTEIVGKTKTGSLGFKLGAGAVLGKAYHPSYKQVQAIYLRNRNPDYGYINFTFHATVSKWTGYFQANFAKKASVALFGVNYRLR